MQISESPPECDQSPPVSVRAMTLADIPAGLRLCRSVGWNQLDRDWQRFLDLEPAGCFVACLDGRVCATVTTLTYGTRFGWLGMLLTDPEVRRKGLGSELLGYGCSYLASAGVETVRLDGTPMGRGLYLRHGFVDEYEVERWEGRGAAFATRSLPPIDRRELERVCAWDARIFGADRSGLLARIWEENPGSSALLLSGNEIQGYVLGRAGFRAEYLGPWVALSVQAAETLLHEFLSRHAGRSVYVDVCTVNPSARRLVESCNFQHQRSLSRMYRGPNRCPGEPGNVYGIAGPELG